MGISFKRDRLLPRARALYAQGMHFKDIGAALGVTKDTVRKWYDYDLKRGTSWDKEREQQENARPERIMELLERRFGRMVLAGEAAAEDPEALGDDYEARLLKMLQIRNGYRKSADKLTSILDAIEEFATFCAQNVSLDELAVVRSAVERFTDKLRKDNS